MMKRNTIIAAAIALVCGCFLNNALAQNDAQAPVAAPAPNQQPVPPGNLQPGVPGQLPPPGGRPLMPRMRQPRISVQRALMSLKQVKLELQHSEGDLGGHKDTAIESCDKAVAELEAVLKAMPQPIPPANRGSFQNNLTRLPPPGVTPPPAAPPAAAPAPAAPQQ